MFKMLEVIELNGKLKVVTRTSNASLKHKKILECMSFYPEGINPKTISRETGLNENTVKAILPKLKGIKKPIRGLYKVVEGGDSIPRPGDLMDWNFHNLVLSVRVDCDPVDNVVVDLGLLQTRFVVGKSGRASLFVSSDWPLNVSSICLVFGYFVQILHELGVENITMDDVKVKTIEFNKDYSNLRLDGLRAITLNSLVEQFKIYQKKSGMRIEHKSKVPFSVENIVDMLVQNPNSLEHNVKLAAQAKQLDRLTEATSKNTDLLFRLMDSLKGV